MEQPTTLEYVPIRILTALTVWIAGNLINISLKRRRGLSDEDFFARILADFVRKLSDIEQLRNVHFYNCHGPPQIYNEPISRIVEDYIVTPWEDDGIFTAGATDGVGILHMYQRLRSELEDHPRQRKGKETRKHWRIER